MKTECSFVCLQNRPIVLILNQIISAPHFTPLPPILFKIDMKLSKHVAFFTERIL